MRRIRGGRIVTKGRRDDVYFKLSHDISIRWRYLIVCEGRQYRNARTRSANFDMHVFLVGNGGNVVLDIHE
jgi:hypothetical protein